MIRISCDKNTLLFKVELPSFPERPVIHLIRLRNPWGNDAEWKGAWSDG